MKKFTNFTCKLDAEYIKGVMTKAILNRNLVMYLNKCDAFDALDKSQSQTHCSNYPMSDISIPMVIEISLCSFEVYTSSNALTTTKKTVLKIYKAVVLIDLEQINVTESVTKLKESVEQYNNQELIHKKRTN